MMRETSLRQVKTPEGAAQRHLEAAGDLDKNQGGGDRSQRSGLTSEQDRKVECRKKRDGAFGEGTISWRQRERRGADGQGMGAWLLKGAFTVLEEDGRLR